MSDLHPLATAVSHPAPSRSKVPGWRIALGLMLAPAVFSLQVVVSYVVAAVGCGASDDARPILIAVNLLAVVLTFGGASIAFANYRATRHEKAGGSSRTEEIGEGRTRFLAYFGLCASSVFGLAVLLQLTAVLIVSTCLGFASFT
ncbi:hypothetical protein [Sphingomonas sp. 10B4]|uniref:hypothetical protein n=1 Tax=Sphingomonas sp. 10B4 TaxID=3048575 RepID=UPI002AB3ADF3|nr:hypothetical protein [Sphingomonas sp. 10B4]MDY7524614.1 hypothetical protein [Sphingomonas sp. 10B4]MEB0282429.1 hypothetical protein [Sphingomonas sp. 10B4]